LRIDKYTGEEDLVCLRHNQCRSIAPAGDEIHLLYLYIISLISMVGFVTVC